MTGFMNTKSASKSYAVVDFLSEAADFHRLFISGWVLQAVIGREAAKAPVAKCHSLLRGGWRYRTQVLGTVLARAHRAGATRVVHRPNLDEPFV